MIPFVSRSEIMKLLELYMDERNSGWRWQPYKYILNHIRCGYHSNIPICCMIFFLVFWIPLFYLLCFQWVKQFINWYPPPMRNKKRFDYVPCPFCFIFNRRRKILLCEKDPENCVCRSMYNVK
jgi:hypothetical protein